jgi:FtsZ-interacting cell division protein ZipA
MRMSNLQLGLIIAGVLLVIGVIIFNAWQERRIRRRIDAAFRPRENVASDGTRASRVEPTLRAIEGDAEEAVGGAARSPPAAATPAHRPGKTPDESFAPPMEIIKHPEVAATEVHEPVAVSTHAEPAARRSAEMRAGAQPDPDIESIVTLQSERAIAAQALGAALQGRFGKPVRWFGRVQEGAPWQLLTTDTPGSFTEFAGCLLLADRNGAASRGQLEMFTRVTGELARTLPAAYGAPEIDAEVARAELLDRLCADVDVQIGLTIIKPDTAAIAGTRLRGVAEAAGFRLAPGGRFEFVHEETGSVEYALTNLRSEPFTAESLRLTATHGVVFLLDVPRVADPPRTFDRMKLAAKRMAKTLHADIVDDNRRPLDDAAFAAIRAQVDAASQALSRAHIDPGSARAMALFGA